MVAAASMTQLRILCSAAQMQLPFPVTLSSHRDCHAVQLLQFHLWIIDGHAGAAIGVLAKIESADSVGNLEDILDAVDGAMVARGDLGAELPVEEVGCLSAPIYAPCTPGEACTLPLCLSSMQRPAALRIESVRGVDGLGCAHALPVSGREGAAL